MAYYRTGFGFGGAMTPVVKNILFANTVIYVIGMLNYNLNSTLFNWFILDSNKVLNNFEIWRLASYMFLHGGLFHILFNMFVFWMFGRELEEEWGSTEFLKFYFICGIGAGLLNILLSAAPTIGASGAVYGIMVAYALRYPNREILVYFMFPVKIKYVVGFLALFSFFSTWGSQGDGIAHAAHLGGIVVGYIYLRYKRDMKSIANIFKSQPKKPKFKHTPGSADEEKVEYYRHKIDEILDKINRVGYLNLSDEEKELLEEGSRYLREHDDTEYH